MNAIQISLHRFAACLEKFTDRYKRQTSSVAFIKNLRESLNAARRVWNAVVQYDDGPGYEILSISQRMHTGEN